MKAPFGPTRWAIEITTVLNTVLGPEHFPIDVIRVARDYTAQRFPGDAITMAEGANLPGFDGALYRAPHGKSGWGIVYNNAVTSPGRAARRMSFDGIPHTGRSSIRRTSSPPHC